MWAGGDCVRGGDDLTVTAVQHGKLAAHSIDRFLAGWKQTQAAYRDQVRELFAPVPIWNVDSFDHEIVGRQGVLFIYPLLVIGSGQIEAAFPTAMNRAETGRSLQRFVGVSNLFLAWRFAFVKVTSATDRVMAIHGQTFIFLAAVFYFEDAAGGVFVANGRFGDGLAKQDAFGTFDLQIQPIRA